MKQVNQYLFYYLGTVLSPLRELKEQTPLIQISADLQNAESMLKRLLDDELVPLTVARPAAHRLLNRITSVISIWKDHDTPKERYEKLSGEKLGVGDHYWIVHNLETFETVFAAELHATASYFAPRLGIYSTTDLIDRTEELFEASLREHLPEQAVIDIRQAGRCLAFNVPTAAGFHIIRATEAVLRQYYAAVTGKTPKSKMRSWRVYYKQLLRYGVDPKILAVIDQIRELYRNPVIHPEETLTLPQATTLLGVAQAAIVMLLSDLMERQKAKAVLSPASAPVA